MLSDQPNLKANNCPILDIIVPHDGKDVDRLPQIPWGSVESMNMNGYSSTDIHLIWDGYRDHLARLDVAICRLDNGHWVMPLETADAPLPFARRSLHDTSQMPVRFLKAKLGCGQDEQRRDVMIKMVDSGTMELQIYHHLAECPDLYEAHNFPCVLPPTTIINSPDRISFVAMPMWGSSLCIPEFDRIQQVLTFIRCTLTGLAYLHDHRIAHRDIHETNILVNFYSYDEDPECFDQRLREHNQGPAARYAIFDFDLSLQLPRQTSLKDCRRPSEEGFTGNSTYRPCDVYQGESYYNPFAFDVGCLGNLFVYHFVEAIPAVPSLALLFAKMTTHRIDDRWTASEALAFVQDMEVELPSAVKQSCVTLKIDLDALDDPELYWSRLSPELQIAWQRHRVPPVSWNTRVLRWLITFEIGYAVVSSVRRFLHA